VATKAVLLLFLVVVLSWCVLCAQTVAALHGRKMVATGWFQQNNLHALELSRLAGVFKERR
jgi:hypothetical protein